MRAVNRKMGKATFGLLSLLLLIGCSSLETSNKNQPVQFERQWSRGTVDDKYMGQRYQASVTPVLSPDIIVTGNGTDSVVAFSRESGHQVWKKNIRYGTEGLFFDQEKGVFFGANDGRFYNVDLATGVLGWNYPLNSESTAAPLIVGQYVYHMAMNGTLYAIEKESGRVLWVKAKSLKSNLSIRGTAQPVFADGKIYAGHADGMFTAYNAVDGAIVWEKQLSERSKFNDIDARPLVTEECILVATYSEALYCLDKTNGDTRWVLNEAGSSRPITAEGRHIFYATDEAVLVIDLGSGKILKTHKTKPGFGMPTGAVPYKSWLIVGFNDGPLVLMDKETGEWVDTFYPGRGVNATPALDEKKGEVYLVSNQANIYKLRIKNVR